MEAILTAGVNNRVVNIAAPYLQMEAAASFFLGGANRIVLRSSGECSCGKMQDNCSIDPIDLPPTRLLLFCIEETPFQLQV